MPRSPARGLSASGTSGRIAQLWKVCLLLLSLPVNLNWRGCSLVTDVCQEILCARLVWPLANINRICNTTHFWAFPPFIQVSQCSTTAPDARSDSLELQSRRPENPIPFCRDWKSPTEYAIRVLTNLTCRRYHHRFPRKWRQAQEQMAPVSCFNLGIAASAAVYLFLHGLCESESYYPLLGDIRIEKAKIEGWSRMALGDLDQTWLRGVSQRKELRSTSWSHTWYAQRRTIIPSMMDSEASQVGTRALRLPGWGIRACQYAQTNFYTIYLLGG